MTGLERSFLERLEIRLFGEDGEGGAIGTIRSEMKAGFVGLDGRVGDLELAKARYDAVVDDRRRSKERISTERRWRVGLALGVMTSAAVGILNFLR